MWIEILNQKKESRFINLCHVVVFNATDASVSTDNLIKNVPCIRFDFGQFCHSWVFSSETERDKEYEVLKSYVRDQDQMTRIMMSGRR